MPFICYISYKIIIKIVHENIFFITNLRKKDNWAHFGVFFHIWDCKKTRLLPLF